MPPNFFSYSTLKNVLTFDSEGILVMVEDAEPDTGYTSIIDMPKNEVNDPYPKG